MFSIASTVREPYAALYSGRIYSVKHLDLSNVAGEVFHVSSSYATNKLINQMNLLLSGCISEVKFLNSANLISIVYHLGIRFASKVQGTKHHFREKVKNL